MIDKVRKGMECCVAKVRGATVKDCSIECPYFHEGVFCKNALHGDVKQIIHQLEADLQREKDRHQYTIDAANVMKDEALKFESRLAQAERERDAAIKDLSDRCLFCKHIANGTGDDACKDCFQRDGNRPWAPMIRTNFEWRGPCPENKKEDENGN